MIILERILELQFFRDLLIILDCKPKRVDLLIKYGADLCLQNNAGFSAFYFINKKVPQCMQALGNIYSIIMLDNCSISFSFVQMSYMLSYEEVYKRNF